MRVWIDLSNSPHPLLFRPIAKRLEAEGAQVLVTVRDHAQTSELALRFWPEAEVIGGEAQSPTWRKRTALGARVRLLAGWARRTRPDVALSHNSYSQICAARLTRLPVVTAMDYEHQPANHLAFRLAQRILVPESLPASKLARQGGSERKLVRYEGFKEQVYLADFEPDPDILASLGIVRSEGRRLAVLRAGPIGAAYHRRENPVFERLVCDLDDSGAFTTVVLTRHIEQRRSIGERALPRTVVPEHAVDARSLLCEADLFVGAGGTMTREAALLGTPAFSVFSGPPATMDAELARDGLLTCIPADASPLTAILQPVVRNRMPISARLANLRDAGERIIEAFAATVTATAGMERGGS